MNCMFAAKGTPGKRGSSSRSFGKSRTACRSFLFSSDKHAQKVAWVLRLVERLDVVLQQYFKKLVATEDLWEIRTQLEVTVIASWASSMVHNC